MEADDLRERLFDESQSSNYPYVRKDIRERYKDTSQLLFKKLLNVHRGSFLSFGSRRSSLISNYGNTPTFMRRSHSTSGALEYTVEQYPSLKFNGNHALPSVMLEEKEEESEAKDANADAEIDAPLLNRQASLDSLSRNSTNAKFDREESVSSSATIQASIAESNLAIENNSDYNFDSKNHKSFLHYDMPVSHKNTLDVKLDSSIPSINNTIQKSEVTINLPSFQNNTQENVPTNAANSLQENDKPVSDNQRHKNTASRHEEMYEIIESLRKSISALSEMEESIAKESKGSTRPKFPVIRAIDKNDKLSVSTKNKTSASLFLPSTSKVNLINSLQLTTFGSTKETVSCSPDEFLRSSSPIKNYSRLSKRVTNRIDNSDSDISRSSDCMHTSFCNDSDGGVSMFPPLVSSSEVHDLKYEMKMEYSTPPLINLNNCASPRDKKREETPAKFGIHGLAADQAVNKSFIVIQPSKTSNSIGLAPLSYEQSSNIDFTEPFSRQMSLPLHAKQKHPKYKKMSDTLSNKYNLFLSETSESDSSQLKDSQSLQNVTPVFLFSRGIIKAIPYEEAFQGTVMKDDHYECSLSTNSSRLCVIM